MNKDEKYLLAGSSLHTIVNLGLIGVEWALFAYLVYIRPLTNKNYNLKKDFNAKKIKIVDFPKDIIENTNKVNSNKINTINEDQIKKFVSVLEKNTKEENLKLLNNNLKTLNIKKSSFFFHKMLGIDTIAAYVVGTNTIKLSEKEYNDAIYHELFHLASSYYYKKEKIYFSGFSVLYSNNQGMGNGINEGYTQLLTNRLFNDTTPYYVMEQNCASIVEAIVGKEKIMDLYFNADLNGLISELSKYSSKDDAYNFIRNLDILSAHIADNHLNKKSRALLTDLLYDVNTFLTDSFNKKLVSMGYTDSEKEAILDKFYGAFPYEVTFNGFTYNVFYSSKQKKK